MKAIRITRTGGPEVLEYVELPTPEPGLDEVLVKAHAIGVCMPETYVRKGTYRWMPKLPAIAVTAYANPEDRVRALVAGYQNHVPKPVDANVLAASIAKLVAR